MKKNKVFLKASSITLSIVLTLSLLTGTVFAEEKNILSAQNNSATDEVNSDTVLNDAPEQTNVESLQSDPANDLRVAFTNDIHGHAGDEVNEKKGKLTAAGYARVKGYYDQQQQEYNNTLLFDAGDYFQGNSFAAVDSGQGVAELMNKMNYDAIVPGNHEFDYGLTKLKSLYKTVGASVIAVNIRDKDGNLVFDPYKIIQKGDWKVGVFGITTQESKSDAGNNPDSKDLDFGTNKSVIEDSQNAVNELKSQGCNVILALAHLGNEESYSYVSSNDIADQVTGINAIMDGHVHRTYAYSHNNVKIVSAGSYSQDYGTIDVTYSSSHITPKPSQVRANFHPANDLKDVAVNAQVQAKYEEITAEHDEILGKVIGHTPSILVGQGTRKAETNFSRFLARSVLNATDGEAEIGFVHGGTIRQSIAAGDVTFGNLLDAIPFDNRTVIIEMTGQDIIDQVNEVYQDASDVPVVTGMTVNTVKQSQANENDAKNQLLSVTVGGRPVDTAKTYRVATINYLANGGSAHSVMARCKQIADIGSMRDSLVAYFKTVDFDELNAADPCLYFRTHQTANVNIKKDDAPWSDYEFKQMLLVSSNGYSFNLSMNGTVASGLPVNDTYSIYVDGQDTTQMIEVSRDAEAEADLNYYTLSFEANGAETGVPPAALVCAQGVQVQMPNADSMSKQGYTFANWNTVADGSGMNYNAGDSYTIAGKTSFYATWKAQEKSWDIAEDSQTPKTGDMDVTASVSLVAMSFIVAAALIKRKKE